ncbi:Gfo/Idh/MocA family protein [Ruegeria meonggei]|uniref:Putative oxidoreductase YdgJ n=1 Tax=Ruegeria meonggei TaxID=1446476 RepID=A0A1X6YXL3_9RHOB|nr:Gfo/Idh/MocA family oxidoreductase [Ruegeria meonggei]SLN32292.1 putative oxidoreductase YdgJ [Ruegeria meonggei]
MNIALIGLGMVAGTHVAAIQSSGRGLNLAGVLGRDPDRTVAFATQHKTRAYNSVEEIAQDPVIDFAIVATPPDQRLPLVRALATAGKPILMEKPIERTLSAAREIVTLCEDASVPLAIVFQHRARAASAALRTALMAGELGDIATVDIRVPWWRDQSYYDAPGRGTYGRDGGGVMISQAIHTLDLAMWLLGPISSVQALMTQTPLHQLEAEDWAGALFEMECGAVGTMMATTADFPGSTETITIQGTKAKAQLGSGVLLITYLDGKTTSFGETASTGGGADPMAFTHEWHQSVIEDFARAITSGTTPLAAARSALLSHAVIDAMQTASRTGQRTKVAS